MTDETLGEFVSISLYYAGFYEYYSQIPSNHKTCKAFVQCWTSVEDIALMLYKYYTNVLCLLGSETFFGRTMLTLL